MSDSDRIHVFLQRARRRALLENGIRTGSYALVALVVSLAVLALLALMAGPAASWPYLALAAICACLGGGAALGFVLPSRLYAEPVALARLVGERHPPLASDLLSAVELEAARTGGGDASSEMTAAFYAAVAEATAPVVVDDIIPLDRAVRAVAVAGVLVLALLGACVGSPGVMGRGLRILFHTPTLFEGAAVAHGPLVGDVRVTYEFPPYTGLSRQTIEGATGDLRAVRGTRVHIEMRPLRTARQAKLLLGDEGETGTVALSVDRSKIETHIVLSESSSYRVWLQPFLGRPLREERAHPIVVESDEPPEVDITGPADRVELPAPRPVEVAYHARDDYGLAEVALVYRINGGPEQRVLLKNAQGAREVRGSTTFEPSSAMLTPGAQVAYHIEATDRDDVSGGKAGVSRTLTLVIHNPRGGVEEQLARQHELLEKLIGGLADRLDLERGGGAGGALEHIGRLRDIHEAEQPPLAELARLVERQRRAPGGSKTQAGPLATAVARLGKLGRDEEELLAAAGKSDAPAAWARLAAAMPRHAAELENAVLALDDVIGRQRLDDLAATGKDLLAAQRRLVELLERYQASGDEQLRRQIEREARELRDRIAELAHKIAEVKARNEVSPEWMNLPDTRKAMETAARLDALLAKGDARALGDALAELGDSLASLRDVLDRQAGEFGDMRFPQESRALAEVARKLGDLEGDQRGVADDSHVLAKEVDGELARRVEAQQGEFLAKAKQKLDHIQRKLAGGPPRELGSSAETANEAVRENLRQLRRLLPAREWNEAQREAERMVDGIDHVRHLSNRQRSMRRLASPMLDSYEADVEEAAGAARELAADLERAIPKGGEVMTPEQRSRTRDLGQRQSSVEERARGLLRDLSGRDEAAPGAQPAAAALEQIAGQMRQAGQDLEDGAAHEGAGRAREAADRLAELRRNLGRRSSEGSASTREPVRIPDAEAFRAPREWRQELMEAMREKAPEKFRDEVRRYYEALVR